MIVVIAPVMAVLRYREINRYVVRVIPIKAILCKGEVKRAAVMNDMMAFGHRC